MKLPLFIHSNNRATLLEEKEAMVAIEAGKKLIHAALIKNPEPWETLTPDELSRATSKTSDIRDSIDPEFKALHIESAAPQRYENIQAVLATSGVLNRQGGQYHGTVLDAPFPCTIVANKEGREILESFIYTSPNIVR